MMHVNTLSSIFNDVYGGNASVERFKRFTWVTTKEPQGFFIWYSNNVQDLLFKNASHERYSGVCLGKTAIAAYCSIL